MPLFYFHLRTPAGDEPDEIGLDLPDLEHAYLEAWRTVPGLFAEIARRGGSPLHHAFVIADAAGTSLLELPFAEPLRAEPRARPADTARVRQLAREIAAMTERSRETAERSRAMIERFKRADAPDR